MSNTSQISATTGKPTFTTELCAFGNDTMNSSDIYGNTTNATQCLSRDTPLSSSVMDYSEYTTAVLLNQYYLYFIVGIGLPGNIAALATVLRMKPMTSSSVYMIALSTMDSISIIIKELYFQLTWFDVQLFDFGCQMIIFAGSFAMQYSNWILIGMTVERFIAISFPLRVSEFCTKRKALYVLSLITVLLIGLNFHHFFIIEEGLHPRFSYMCGPKPENSEFYFTAWHWIDGAAYAFIPFIALAICNTLIIFTIRSSIKKKKDLTNLQQKQTSQQMQITAMLVTVSVVFIILTMPNCIFFIYENYWNYKEDAHQLAKYYLVSQIVFILSDLNHAVNFYLYFLSGKKFRKNFYMMLQCKSHRNVLRSSTTMTSKMSKSSRYIASSPASNSTRVSSGNHRDSISSNNVCYRENSSVSTPPSSLVD